MHYELNLLRNVFVYMYVRLQYTHVFYLVSTQTCNKFKRLESATKGPGALSHQLH